MAAAESAPAAAGEAQMERGSYCGWLRNPNHQLIGGQDPIIYRVSTTLLVVQDFATIHSITQDLLTMGCK